MKSSPIYNHVNIQGRASRDFGAYDGFNQHVLVGTSRTNSHEFANISVQRRANEDGTVEFSLWIDGVLVKRGVLDGKEFAFNLGGDA